MPGSAAASCAAAADAGCIGRSWGARNGTLGIAARVDFAVPATAPVVAGLNMGAWALVLELSAREDGMAAAKIARERAAGATNRILCRPSQGLRCVQSNFSVPSRMAWMLDASS